MKNTSKLKLLAGPMTIIADDIHVARISIDVSFFHLHSSSTWPDFVIGYLSS